MARYFENTSTFNFSWDQVACGYWKRYPNPQSTHVLSEDTWTREVKDGCLHTKRVLTKTNRVPKWGERFFSAKSVKIIEESICDPKNKTLVTYTRNLGYTKVMIFFVINDTPCRSSALDSLQRCAVRIVDDPMLTNKLDPLSQRVSVVEKVEYKCSGPGQTVARRSAWIDSQVFGFSRAIRAFGVERFRKNCTSMVNGFNDVLHAMFPRAGVAHPSHVTHTLKEMREAAAAATDRAKHNVLSSVNRT